MLNEQEAILALYTTLDNKSYKTTSSWVRTREFTLDATESKTPNQFVLDERFVRLASPDSNARL